MCSEEYLRQETETVDPGCGLTGNLSYKNIFFAASLNVKKRKMESNMMTLQEE